MAGAAGAAAARWPPGCCAAMGIDANAIDATTNHILFRMMSSTGPETRDSNTRPPPSSRCPRRSSRVAMESLDLDRRLEHTLIPS
jgi:hypothetical protein